MLNGGRASLGRGCCRCAGAYDPTMHKRQSGHHPLGIIPQNPSYCAVLPHWKRRRTTPQAAIMSQPTAEYEVGSTADLVTAIPECCQAGGGHAV
jgi:hypothetical protein